MSIMAVQNYWHILIPHGIMKTYGKSCHYRKGSDPVKKNIVLIGVQILVFGAFVFVNLGLVFTNGVCCADDALNAQAVKNLANGLGYVSALPQLETHYHLIQFDPGVATGPTVALPAALMIKLVGNVTWAPGMAAVIVWSVLLLCIGVLLNKNFKNKTNLTIGTIVFFFFCYTLMAYHYGQWYALLGEIPAALLIILAVLVYFSRDSKINLFLTGLLFSLAVQSKLIALLPFGSFLLFAAIYPIVSNKKTVKASIRSIFHSLFLIAIGFTIPIFLFELWKLLAMGPSGYLKWWSIYRVFVGKYGASTSQSSWGRVLERINLARNRFGIFLPYIFVILGWIGSVIRKEKRLFSLASVFISIISINTLYWLFFSIGWARYYIITLVLIIFVLTLPFLSNQLKISQKTLYAIVLTGLSIYNINTIHISYPFAGKQLFQPSANNLALQEVGNQLSSKLDERPFYTLAWFTAVDVEYIMDTHLNFEIISAPEADLTKPFIFVVNTKFIVKENQTLTNLSATCETKEIGPYIYGECNQP